MSELIQAANLPQLELEIKFYLEQTAQNIIEVGYWRQSKNYAAVG